MFHRSICFTMIVLTGLVIVSERNLFAQRCIGTTAYLVRDAKGKIMTPEEMKKTVVTIDGVIMTEDQLRNPPKFFSVPDHACGQIGELEIASSGKQMILYFDIGEHNTYYEIDSLPFQEGVFHLRSLRCKDGAAPPRIDNRTVGKCLVSAENWEGSDKEWVRYIVPSRNSYGGGYIWKSADFCRGKPLDVITSREALAAAWKSYREATNGNPLPDVDFQREMVLIPYLPARSSAYSIESLRVDKSCSTSITFPSTTIRIPVPLNQIKRLSSCCFLEKPIILTERNAPSVTKESDCS